jgi:hypothetical protein
MPLILLAGTVTAKPKIMDFPAAGRPRCEVRIEAEGSGQAVIFRVLAFDDLMPEAELLMPGDPVSICGTLQIESRNGQLAGIFVEAPQLVALRTRSHHPAMRARA